MASPSGFFYDQRMIAWLEDDDPFPDTALALGEDSDAPGLLAAGGGLSTARLRAAYRRGIFPWFGEGQPLLWWSTAPRMVLPVDQFKVSRSLGKTLRRFARTPGCEIRIDHAFDQVLACCAGTPRAGQSGTWILPEMQAAYRRWHREGSVHSFETWINGRLVGGLYGVNIGRMFFGESMFSHQTDASKIALAALVGFCRSNGITVIDCQQQTSHLASLGAEPWSRERFEHHLKAVVDLPEPVNWTYDLASWSSPESSA